MPDVNYTPLVEGGAITANSLQSRFDDVKAGVNSLPGYAIEPYGLRAEQLDTVVPFTVPPISNDVEWYTMTPTRSHGTAYTWTTVNPANVPLSATFSSVKLGMAYADRVAAIIVRANVHFGEAWGNINPNSLAELDNFQGVFAVQWFNGVSWAVINSTIRQIPNLPLLGGTPDHADSLTEQDVALACMITDKDISGAHISGVRIVCSAYDIADDGTYTAARLKLGRDNFSVIPLHAKDAP